LNKRGGKCNFNIKGEGSVIQTSLKGGECIYFFKPKKVGSKVLDYQNIYIAKEEKTCAKESLNKSQIGQPNLSFT